jgi:hypothetical protein
VDAGAGVGHAVEEAVDVALEAFGEVAGEGGEEDVAAGAGEVGGAVDGDDGLAGAGSAGDAGGAGVVGFDGGALGGVEEELPGGPGGGEGVAERLVVLVEEVEAAAGVGVGEGVAGAGGDLGRLAVGDAQQVLLRFVGEGVADVVEELVEGGVADAAQPGAWDAVGEERGVVEVGEGALGRRDVVVDDDAGDAFDDFFGAFVDDDDLGGAGGLVDVEAAASGPGVGGVVVVDVAEDGGVAALVQDEADVAVDAGGPHAVVGALDAVELEAGEVGLDLEVEDRRLHGRLL